MNVCTTNRLLWILYAVVACISSTAFSYWLAIWKHPTALWFWRDILGVLP